MRPPLASIFIYRVRDAGPVTLEAQRRWLACRPMGVRSSSTSSVGFRTDIDLAPSNSWANHPGFAEAPMDCSDVDEIEIIVGRPGGPRGAERHGNGPCRRPSATPTAAFWRKLSCWPGIRCIRILRWKRVEGGLRVILRYQPVLHETPRSPLQSIHVGCRRRWWWRGRRRRWRSIGSGMGCRVRRWATWTRHPPAPRSDPSCPRSL